MEDAVTVLLVFLIIAVLFLAAAVILLCLSEYDNYILKKENEMFRRLWNEQAAMQNSSLNAYAEIFRRAKHTTKQ